MNCRFVLLPVLLGSLFLGLPGAAQAAAEKKAAATPAAETSAKSIPFHGKVTAVDPAAKTFSVKGKEKDHVFHLTDKSSIIGKDGQPADLSAIPVGEFVRGAAVKNGDEWEARKVTIGVKDGAPVKSTKPVKVATTPSASPKTAAAPTAPIATPAAAPAADATPKPQ